MSTQLIHKLLVITLILLSSYLTVQAQSDKALDKAQINTELPYATIPEYPSSYTAATVTARMIDGLGFRYYWATEGLRTEDLEYKTGNDARTTAQTIEHIYDLTLTIFNGTKQKPNVRPTTPVELTFEERRAKTLYMLKETSDILRNSTNEDLEKYDIIFKRGEKESTFPFWHQINGPIADALWHTGQIVAFRRASGNPIDARVNVFMGNVRK